MTSTPSSTSPPHNAFRYDVFLSFSGKDTRHTFTDHLYHALLGAGVRTFRDDDDIERGEGLEPEIIAAITKSKASIVVLSENYAQSTWCLDELWLILEQRRRYGHYVLPVFYHVKPSDVRYQTGKFAIAIPKASRSDVRRWKDALRNVADLAGMVPTGYICFTL
ncbi:hypothetical protein QVD17_39473 [Tagetes erecta]|uniref:TIR domain-containing protein n=1 Tax=Tagetes erecta TaxID=13708 RepID=A0AAD8JSF7_TARER|nr:hypothetical protein QVD17_39473 [Tagetes erecta]